VWNEVYKRLIAAISVKEGIMRPQTRPVTVEVKRKRGTQERGRSIWGSLDLSAVAAEMEAGAGELPNDPPVDSVVSSTDVENEYKPQGEQDMPDPQEADVAQVAPEAPANPEAPKQKTKTPRVKKAKSAPKQRVVKETVKPASVATEAQFVTVRGKRKIYSEKERAQKLAQIEKSIRRGESIKSAVGHEGISEQTYYQWKKNVAPASKGDELTDLVELEAENARLKKRLAEHLRKENAELRKRLGEA
jgi:hypothetical protein